jgi:hypothetical protein
MEASAEFASCASGGDGAGTLTACMLQHVDDFEPAELEIRVTATAGAASTAVTA